MLRTPLATLCAVFLSCSSTPGTSATATISETGGAQGTASFEDTSDGLKVTLTLTSVPGDGSHGVHLHATGDCAANAGPDGGPVAHGAAGAHYNPTDAGHACPPTTARHAGDLGNISITNGGGTLELITKELTASQVIGRAIILHSAADDCATQPTGNSGSRIGCAVITAK